MAESIAVHFRSATWTELRAELDLVAQRDHSYLWHYPAQADYHVIAYEYDEVLKEYEDQTIETIRNRLGTLPSATLCVELLRSQGDLAVDSATSLVRTVLARFEGVVNDLCEHSDLWSLDEIENVQKRGAKFLDCYRPSQRQR